MQRESGVLRAAAGKKPIFLMPVEGLVPSQGAAAGSHARFWRAGLHEMGGTLLSRFGLPVDRFRAGLDQRDQVAPDRDRVLRILKPAQQERMDAEPVIFEH